MPTVSVHGTPTDLAALAAAWLHHEATGARLRMAHRCIEWDGWEEGLVDSMLGPEEQEEDWFKSWEEPEPPSHDDDERPGQGAESPERTSDSPVAAISVESLALSNSSFTTSSESEDALAPAPALALAKRKLSGSAAGRAERRANSGSTGGKQQERR